MNKVDREFARQAWTENDWEGHLDTQKLIQLVRADEREACCAIVWGLCESDNVAQRTVDAIRARGQE